MKLLRILTENLRNVPDGEHLFADRTTGEPLSLVLVTGPAASGKTTILEAIAMAKERAAGYGPPPDARAFLRRGESRGRIVLALRLDDDERRRANVADPIVEIDMPLAGLRPEIEPRLANVLSSYTHQPVGKWEYFPAHRSLDAAFGPEAIPDEREEAYLRLRRDPDKYRGVIPWLRARLAADTQVLGSRLQEGGFATPADVPDSLVPLRRGLVALCPRLRLTGLGPEGDLWFARDDGSRARIGELSDAEKDAVLFAATFQRIGLRHSIVLIDRPLLFSHPDDHARILEGLAGLAEDNQLIVATTSPALLSTKLGQHAVRLDRRR